MQIYLKRQQWLVSLILLTLCTSAYAGIETDKNAGICTAYMVLRGKDAGANVAINMADNQKRAQQLGSEWMRSYKGRSNASEAMAYKGVSACRNVGVNPSSY